MNSVDFKTLKKLAEACRKAGIKHFKNADLEFTLSDEGPVSNYKKRQSKVFASKESSLLSQDVESEHSLTEEQLLFFSVGNAEESNQ